MLYDDPDFGFSLSLPDTLAPEQAQAHITTVQQHYANQAAQQQQQQQRYESLGTLGRIVTDAFAPPTQHVPVISHTAAAAMTPQGFQQTAGMMQQAAQMQQHNAMQQERMQQMNRIEQERMRQRNAEVLQQQKDRKQEFQIRKQEFDYRKQERDLAMKEREAAAKDRERQARMPHLDPTRGAAYYTDPETGEVSMRVIDQNIYNRATAMPGYGGGGGGGGGGAGVSGGAGNVLTLPDGSTWEPADRYQSNWVNRQTGEIIPKADLARRGGVTDEVAQLRDAYENAKAKQAAAIAKLGTTAAAKNEDYSLPPEQLANIEQTATTLYPLPRAPRDKSSAPRTMEHLLPPSVKERPSNELQNLMAEEGGDFVVGREYYLKGKVARYAGNGQWEPV